LRLELRASGAMAAVVMAAHLAGASCLVIVFPGVGAAAVALLISALGALTAWERALHRSRNSVRSLELREGGAAMLELSDGRRVACTVSERRNVNRWWVTLPLRGKSRRIVVVTRDMVPAGDFRRLRIWALWGRLPGLPVARVFP